MHKLFIVFVSHNKFLCLSCTLAEGARRAKVPFWFITANLYYFTSNAFRCRIIELLYTNFDDIQYVDEILNVS